MLVLLQMYFLKGTGEKYFGLCGHMASVTAIHLYPGAMEAAVDSKEMNNHAVCQLTSHKEVNVKAYIYCVLFHLNQMPRIGKSIETVNELVVSGDEGVGEMESDC